MNICVFGAGAIGSHLSVRLAQDASNRVSVVARGAQLDAITERGLHLLIGDARLSARPEASADVRKLQPPALALVTLKAHAIAAAADDLAWLAGAGAILVFITNGVPWWYAAGRGASLSARTRGIVDPAGLMQRLPLDRVVGGVAYSPNTVVEPGVARCAAMQSRFIVGAVRSDGAAAVAVTASALEHASIAAPIAADIREEVWRKLLFNVVLGPLATLVRGGNREVMGDPVLRDFGRSLMRETAAIARAQRVEIAVDEDVLLPERLPPHKPSMLQDLEAGRRLETDSILLAVQALARDSGVPTPALDLVTAMITVRTRPAA